ncbi:MFS transporter [Streptomyces minutiscleroticus]|uniref:MFS transporter n=1 Tax=Streptomyces minutiscleroticus TaxID=68238 RepID=A0A918U8R8_9ACTN|nr:MFS transporter [Streptomyces minutiscleroticus]GGY12542.1 MFS transporter [Streptomyces minutiscleroticus]
MPLSLLAMMLCTFCVGTAESVIAGILPAISQDAGVSLSAVGMLISVYAIAVVVTGPCVTALTARMRRSRLLPAMMGVFILGNALAALAPGFAWLVAGRVVSALAHSTLIAVFVAAARDMAPVSRKAAYGAKVTLGIGLATVAGVPAGTLIGQTWGWRATFWALAGLSLAFTLLLMRCTVPEAPATGGTAGHDAVRGGRRGRGLPLPMLLVAVVIVLGTGGVFALYTYASPYLTQAAGFAPSTVTLLLWLYGLGGIAGNTVGARAADRHLPLAVLTTLAAAATGLVLLTLLASSTWAVACLFCLLGAAYFATIPALNSQIVATAGTASPTMALTVNNSAFCVGIALGSWLGGTLLSHGHSVLLVPAAGAVLVIAALLLGAVVCLPAARPAARTSGTPSAPDPSTPAGASRDPRGHCRAVDT